MTITIKEPTLYEMSIVIIKTKHAIHYVQAKEIDKAMGNEVLKNVLYRVMHSNEYSAEELEKDEALAHSQLEAYTKEVLNDELSEDKPTQSESENAARLTLKLYKESYKHISVNDTEILVMQNKDISLVLDTIKLGIITLFTIYFGRILGFTTEVWWVALSNTLQILLMFKLLRIMSKGVFEIFKIIRGDYR